MKTKAKNFLKSGVYYHYLEKNIEIPKNDLKKQLNKDQKIDGIEPVYDFKSICMNSTYLEIVDRSFDVYGKTFAQLVFLYTLPFGGMCFLIYVFFDIIYTMKLNAVVIFVLCFIVFYCFIVLSMLVLQLKAIYKKEYKSYTYRPIRFNFKNKKVYAFDDEGNVFVDNWDNMVFVCEDMPTYFSDEKTEIQGFMLDDNQKIKHTIRFCLGYHKMSSLKQWEFIRLYMQNGPKQFVVDYDLFYQNKFEIEPYHLMYCIDIDKKKETPYLSREVIFLSNYSLYALVTRPLFFVVYLGRRLMMKFAKIPYWPKWVNEECKIDEDDLYNITARNNLDIYRDLPEVIKEK